jgi:exodeoxyribonuclease VII small subunit
MSSRSKPDFETAMNRLEEITDQLESGDVALEKAIELFEEGLKLSRRCGDLLEAAQLRVDKLLEGRDGAAVSEPMDSPE